MTVGETDGGDCNTPAPYRFFKKNMGLNISVQLQLVITFKVSNSLDPDKALTECRA